MADAFASLAADPVVRHRMGEAGRKRAVARFMSSRLVDDIDQLYSSGLTEKRNAAAER
jgi:glycosyltransferase involved in cell wall biosynthesis